MGFLSKDRAAELDALNQEAMSGLSELPDWSGDVDDMDCMGVEEDMDWPELNGNESLVVQQTGGGEMDQKQPKKSSPVGLFVACVMVFAAAFVTAEAARADMLTGPALAANAAYLDGDADYTSLINGPDAKTLNSEGIAGAANEDEIDYAALAGYPPFNADPGVKTLDHQLRLEMIGIAEEIAALNQPAEVTGALIDERAAMLTEKYASPVHDVNDLNKKQIVKSLTLAVEFELGSAEVMLVSQPAPFLPANERSSASIPTN